MRHLMNIIQLFRFHEKNQQKEWIALGMPKVETFRSQTMRKDKGLFQFTSFFDAYISYLSAWYLVYLIITRQEISWLFGF